MWGLGVVVRGHGDEWVWEWGVRPKKGGHARSLLSTPFKGSLEVCAGGVLLMSGCFWWAHGFGMQECCSRCLLGK
jgi:hypothetical protein